MSVESVQIVVLYTNNGKPLLFSKVKHTHTYLTKARMKKKLLYPVCLR